MTLLEKKIECHMVMVDITSGEQRDPRYLEVNPQGKVPAIRVHNHASLPDVVLYESMAIVEWLDEQFPETSPLYPADFDMRIATKLWQYWELSMAEDMWPLSRQQVDGVLWRFMHSRESFYDRGPAKQAGLDPFYSAKVSRIYECTYLSKADGKRRALRTLRAFKMLDMALESKREKVTSGPLFLVGNTLTQADVSAYPRMCKVPQNGLVSTEAERSLFINVCTYFTSLRYHSNSFSKFAAADEVIWDSGSFPKFVPLWGRWIPWWLVVAVGNYRAGLHIPFERITQASLGPDAVTTAMHLVESTPLAAIPQVQPDHISFHFQDNSDSESQDSISSINSPVITLYCSASMPMAVATRVCLYLQHEMASQMTLSTSLSNPSPSVASSTSPSSPLLRVNIQPVDTVLLENLAPPFLSLMPFGEVPVLVLDDKVIYGPHIIVEFMDEKLFNGFNNNNNNNTEDFSMSDTSTRRLLPSIPVERAIVRRWFGWCRTAWFYQIEPLYRHLVLPSRLLAEGIDTQEEFLSRVVCQGGVLPEDASAYLEAAFGDHGLARRDDNMSPYIQELSVRIDTVEAELSLASGGKQGTSLLGHSHYSYADYFVLAIVMLAEVYQGSVVVPSLHPFTYSWKASLLSDSKIAALYLDMCEGNSSQYHPPSSHIPHDEERPAVVDPSSVAENFPSPLRILTPEFWKSL